MVKFFLMCIEAFNEIYFEENNIIVIDLIADPGIVFEELNRLGRKFKSNPYRLTLKVIEND